MLKINFDLFYELNHGSVISNSHQNVKKYWRLVDGNIEVKNEPGWGVEINPDWLKKANYIKSEF